MSEMIERVAKAIGTVAANSHGHTLAAWAVSPEREDCLRFARAAILAMREPTNEMLRAGKESDPASGVFCAVFYPPEPILAWRAMIDAAL